MPMLSPQRRARLYKMYCGTEVTFNTQVLNQNGEPVIVYQDKLMVKARD